MIVGFREETEEEFCDTLSLVEEVGFTSLFTFIFSPRKGTVAEKMDDPVTPEEKSARFKRLCDLQESIAAKRCSSMVGTLQREPGRMKKTVRQGFLPAGQRVISWWILKAATS